MRNILPFILMFCFGISNSQNNVNFKSISKENKELLEKIEKIEKEREERIASYIQNHPDVKRYMRVGDYGIMSIKDIINGKPIYISTYNLDAARATGVIELQPGGSLGLNLDGSGMTVGVWDGGPVQADHPEFMNIAGTQSRINVIDNTVVDGDSGGVSNHATHVAGTIAATGVNPSAKGMAPNVNVKSYNWTSDTTEMIQAINDPTSPIILSNHSYGVPVDPGDGSGPIDSWIMGAYAGDAPTVDNIHYNNPYYLMVASAGNSGNVSYPDGMLSGFDKLTTDKNAKNNLVVANASPTLSPFSNEITNLVINSGSSEGPTDDLRVKPDIAADGTGLFSTVSGGNYATFSGTSMSAPNTTGALLLLQEYYNQLHSVYMKSATLKALVCHTAIDDNANAGPDPIFGWGFLNALEAANTITSADNGEAIISENTLDQGQQYTMTFSAVAGDKIKATICWTDLAGVATGTNDLNNPTPKLINDLDLRITKDNVDYEPWMLDFSSGTAFNAIKGDNIRDNIEVVEIDNFETGTYTITVSHKGTLQGNQGGPFDPQSQDFSLVLTGNNLTLGVDDNDLVRSLAVYPNPSRGVFTISFESNSSIFNSDVRIKIFDISGRSIFDKNYRNSSSIFKETISLDNAKPGVYMINIEAENRITSHKLIID